MKDTFSKWSLFFLFIVLTLVFPGLSLAQGNTATILRVIDGDTLEVSLNGQKERVRLIGVDTPEVYESEKLHRDAERTSKDVKTIKELGARASAFTKSLARKGERVKLEYDWQKRDKYGRLLAFVWLFDGRMLNETIICAGYGNAYTAFPFKQEYIDRFLACQRVAVGEGRGLWEKVASPETPPAPPSPLVPEIPSESYEIRGNKRSMIYHIFGCPNYDDISSQNRAIFKTEEEANKAGYRKAKNCP